MGLFDSLGFGKKQKKKTSTRQKTVRKPRKRTKKAVAEKAIEDPLITVSRQLTIIQESLKETNKLLGSGFNSLREDHHRILEEQTEKISLTGRLLKQSLKELEIDSKILSLVKGKKMRAVEVAQQLGIARQYASSRLAVLSKKGLVKKSKKGRRIYYKA